MNAISHQQPASSTVAESYGTASATAIVRSLTRTMLDAWKHLPVGRRVPKDAKLASLRADVMIGHVKPIEHLMRLSLGAIDAGVPAGPVVQWAKDYVTYCEGYAARKQRRESMGILSFPQRFARLWTKETIEQGEADATCIAIGQGSDLNALRAARVELSEHRDRVDELIALVSERIVELEAKG